MRSGRRVSRVIRTRLPGREGGGGTRAVAAETSWAARRMTIIIGAAARTRRPRKLRKGRSATTRDEVLLSDHQRAKARSAAAIRMRRKATLRMGYAKK